MKKRNRSRTKERTAPSMPLKWRLLTRLEKKHRRRRCLVLAGDRKWNKKDETCAITWSGFTKFPLSTSPNMSDQRKSPKLAIRKPICKKNMIACLSNVKALFILCPLKKKKKFCLCWLSFNLTFIRGGIRGEKEIVSRVRRRRWRWTKLQEQRILFG